MPASEQDIRSSVCLVNGHTDLCVVTGKDTIIVMSDTANEQGVWFDKHWWRPSCKGNVMTILQGRLYTEQGSWLIPDSLSNLIAAQIDSLGALLQRKNTERKELQYYLRCHGVQDEGFQRIAEYARVQAHETDSLTHIYKTLNSSRLKQTMRLLRIGHYTVTWHDNNGHLCSIECEPSIIPIGQVGKPIIIQTVNHSKPKNLHAVRCLPWIYNNEQKIITVKAIANDTICSTLLLEGNCMTNGKHNLPRLFASDGSPVFNKYGYFIGLVSNNIVCRFE